MASSSCRALHEPASRSSCSSLALASSAERRSGSSESRPRVFPRLRTRASPTRRGPRSSTRTATTSKKGRSCSGVPTSVASAARPGTGSAPPSASSRATSSCRAATASASTGRSATPISSLGTSAPKRRSVSPGVYDPALGRRARGPTRCPPSRSRTSTSASPSPPSQSASRSPRPRRRGTAGPGTDGPAAATPPAFRSARSARSTTRPSTWQGREARRAARRSAVVRDLDVRPDGVTARFLRPDRSEGVVRAKTVVLAAHAIETPKLMLVSRGPEHPAGLGNEHDLVGRFLMDHPVQLSWALAPEPVYPFRGPLSTSGIEMLRDGPFRARRSAYRVEIGNDGWSWPAGDATVQAFAQAKQPPARLGRPGRAQGPVRPSAPSREPDRAAPGPAQPRDAGRAARRARSPTPQAQLPDRRLLARGLAAARETHQRLFERLGASEINHAEEPFGAGHITGTCRTGTDPRTSVVDPELRVHGHRNCFVVSTAVFPTVGTANPTLTLAALSLRAAAAVRRSLDPS